MIVYCYRFISQINSSFQIQSFIGDHPPSLPPSFLRGLHFNARIGITPHHPNHIHSRRPPPSISLCLPPCYPYHAGCMQDEIVCISLYRSAVEPNHPQEVKNTNKTKACGLNRHLAGWLAGAHPPAAQLEIVLLSCSVFHLRSSSSSSGRD